MRQDLKSLFCRYIDAATESELRLIEDISEIFPLKESNYLLVRDDGISLSISGVTRYGLNVFLEYLKNNIDQLKND